MRTNLAHLFPESPVVRAVLIFCISYIVILVAWMQVEDSYSYFVTAVTLKVVTELKDTELTEMTRKDSVIYIKFTPLKMKQVLLSAKVDRSHFSFNVPLTLSILAALFPHLQKRLRAFVECLVMLFSVHFLYVFFLAMMLLTILYMDRGIEAASEFRLAAYKFLWGFSGRMLLRVAPFLIGVYIFLRFRKAESR